MNTPIPVRRVVLSIITLVCATVGIAAQVQTKLNAIARTKLQQAMTVAQKNDGERAQGISKLGHPFSMDGNRIMVRAFISVRSLSDTTLILARGGRIRHCFGSIVSAIVPVESFDALCAHSNILNAQLSTTLKPTLNESVKEIRADKVHLGEGLPSKYTGKGVVIGVFDSGIDVDHPDVRTATGSRIRALWDMSDQTGTPPTGFTWGREYTKAQLDAGGTMVAQRDVSGHGTHVAGTAAGNGRGDKDFVGVAPDADLVIVKGTRNDANGGFADDDIVAGCQYIIQKAKSLGQQAVINLSLGGIVGPHDGSELMVQALNGLVEPGYIIVVAAGNEGSQPIHAGGVITSSTNLEALINPINVCEIFEGFCPNDPNYFLTAADIWYTKGSVDTLLVGVYTQEASGLTLSKVLSFPIGMDALDVEVKIGDATIGYVSAITSSSDLPNGSGNILVQISNKGNSNVNVGGQLWGLSLRGAGDGRVDMWAGVPIPEQFPIIGSLGSTIYGNTDMTIGTPATGVNMISVGSYVTKTEWTSLVGPETQPQATMFARSVFSSKGPTRDGRMAPIIAAPGEMIFAARTSAISSGDPGYNASRILPGELYQGMEGTSMATPHVTGVVALMMEAMSNLTLEHIKQVFNRTSRHDGFSPEDNNEMGFGKIDALESCLQVTSDVRNDDVTSTIGVRPNPASERITVTSTIACERLEIVNTMGQVQVSLDTRSSLDGAWTVSTAMLPTGRYHVRIVSASTVRTMPLTIMH